MLRMQSILFLLGFCVIIYVILVLLLRVFLRTNSYPKEFHTEPGYLCPHSQSSHKVIPIADIVEIKYRVMWRSWEAHTFFIKLANGGSAIFTISHNARIERVRLEQELRARGYHGPFTHSPL